MTSILKKYEYYETGSTSDAFYAGNWRAQGFTIGSTGTNEAFYPTRIDIYGEIEGSPGELNIQIRTQEQLSGGTAISSFVGGTTLSTSSWINTYAPTTSTNNILSPNTQYNLICSITGGNAFNYIRDYIQFVGGGYSGGIYRQSSDSGSTWTTTTGSDMQFRVYGIPSVITQQTFNPWIYDVNNNNVLGLSDTNYCISDFQKGSLLINEFLSVVDKFGTAETRSSDMAYTLLDSCDSLTGWNSFVLIPTTSATCVEGSGAITFSKSSAGMVSSLDKTFTNYSITNKQLDLCIYIKDTTTLNKINSIEIQYGSDSSNFYYWDNYYLHTGWNVLRCPKSIRGTYGSPSFGCSWFKIVFQTFSGSSFSNGDIIIDNIKLDVSLDAIETNKIYINNAGTWELFDHYDSFRILKKQNQVSEFEIKIYDIQDAEKVYFKEQAEVLFYAGSSMILKGRIQTIEYGTEFECTAKGFGMEAILLDKEFIKSGDKRIEYDNVSAQTIAKEILSVNANGVAPWTMTPNTGGIFGTDWGTISTRYEYANKLNCLGSLANAINYEWWVSQSSSDNYDNDTFNFAAIRGSTSSVKTFAITGTGANAVRTSREKDVSNMSNYVTCYDDKTEVLTKQGYKFFKDLTLFDDVATLNPNTLELEYYKPIAKQEYDYNGIMHHYKNDNVDLLVTPEHALYCKKIWSKNFERIQSKEIFGKWLNFKKDCKWNKQGKEEFILPQVINTWHSGRGKGHDEIKIYPEKKFSMKLWLEFLGWYLSEGNLHKNIKKGHKIRITQNYPNLNKIINLIQNMGFKPFICKNPDRIEFYDKQLYKYLEQFGKAKDKFIPEFIKELSTEQIKHFLDILFEGDETHNKQGNISIYYSCSKKLIEDVSELLLKCGYGFTFNLRRNNAYSLSVNISHLKCRVKSKHQKEENYKGKIYDITVPNHVFFIRRNNKCIWSGNCLGFGDGDNQLKTSTYQASTQSSFLSANIADTNSTIGLMDASSFPSSGTIRIAEEVINYSGKSSNNLTGCSRGVSSSTAYPHKKDNYVERYFLSSSPQSGSSISTYGLVESTQIDRTLTDLETAELVASGFLVDHADPIERIKIIPDEPMTDAANLDIGDVVTIVDSEASINGDYRIVSIEYRDEYGALTMEIECANVSLEFIEQMQAERQRNQDLSKYMQGSSDTMHLDQSGNFSVSNPIQFKYYLPTNVAAVNEVVLKFTPSISTDYIEHSGTSVSFVDNVFPTTPKMHILVGPDGSEVAISGSPFNVTNGSEITKDLTNEVNGVDVGNWVGIKLIPTGSDINRMKINAEVYQRQFVKSQ